jgi:Glycosyl transferase family 8
MLHRGVIYCATTQIAYLESALISAIALRSLEPTLPITIISDQPLLNLLPLDKHGITPRFLGSGEMGDRDAFFSRAIKTQLFSYSPYQETVFLDADILPLKPLTPIWDYLNQGDWAMVLDRNPTVGDCDHIALPEKTYTLQSLPETTPHFNSGVMVWRANAATQTLFQHWHTEWQHFQKQDQLALVRAIQATQLPIVRLPITYNISPRDAAPILLKQQEVHLLHCWGGIVGAGKFAQFAQNFYPAAVEAATEMTMARVN